MTEIFFGNLPKDIRAHEVEDFFRGFGRILDVQIKDGRGFAFVTMEDRRDAEDAVRKLDGQRFCHSRVTVDISKGRPAGDKGPDRSRGGGFGTFGGRGGFDDRRRDDRDFGRDRYDDRRDDRYGKDRYDDRRGGFDDRRGDSYDRRDRYGDDRRRDFDDRRTDRKRNLKTKFSLLVSGLASRCQWWDLKDLGKKYGPVCFADANKHRTGEGIVCFEEKRDCLEALEKMQGEELLGERMEVRLEFPEEFEDELGGRGRSNSRSREEARGRSRSRSPVGRARSRSRSGSERRYAESRSRSRSVSR